MKSITGKPSRFDDFAEKLKKESPIHISKRLDAPKWLPIVVRVSAIVVALFICALVSEFFKQGTFTIFFTQLFKGTFGTERRIINLLEETAILLIISLAVTPAFKMKFWNIGAEGQVSIGALFSVICLRSLGGKVSDPLLIIICLLAAMAGGALMTLIPAVFKAKWNTNETLFTLMLNYVAARIILAAILTWVPDGNTVMPTSPYGQFPNINGLPYILNIIIVAIITVLLWVYLRFSKHGYEISVVGESVNTAKYVGISVPKVIIRTMILSGALCGIAGWLLVNGVDHKVSEGIAGGRGFTAILVSWLAHFDPFMMVITAFLVAFIGKGASQVAMIGNIGGAFSDIVTAIFFFVVIASEFFVNYKIKFNRNIFKKAADEQADEQSGVEEDNEEQSAEEQVEGNVQDGSEAVVSEQPELNVGEANGEQEAAIANNNETEVTE